MTREASASASCLRAAPGITAGAQHSPSPACSSPSWCCSVSPPQITRCSQRSLSSMTQIERPSTKQPGSTPSGMQCDQLNASLQPQHRLVEPLTHPLQLPATLRAAAEQTTAAVQCSSAMQQCNAAVQRSRAMQYLRLGPPTHCCFCEVAGGVGAAHPKDCRQ